MNKPIALSLFCGVGGMCLGFEQAGFDIALAVDICGINAKTHRKNFPKSTTLCAPVQDLNNENIYQLMQGKRPIDVVIGGPPCQGFSISGKRNASDYRASLLTEFVRIVGLVQPKHFVLENVKGLTQGHCKVALEQAIAHFNALGYQLPDWQVLNAKDYGVPQNRERLFLLGSRHDQPLLSYAKPIGQLVTVADALCDIPDAEDPNCQVAVGRLWHQHDAELSDYARQMRCQRDGRTRWAGLLKNCQTTNHSPAVRARFANTAPGQREPISHFDRLDPNGISPTLTAGSGSAHGRHTARRPIHHKYDRCITIREMARLSGFPDWFEFDHRTWHGARQIGNAVPPPLAKAIAQKVVSTKRKDYAN